MAEGNAHMLRHPPRYESHWAVIRYTGEVNADKIFALCDEIDFAVDYYQYPTVVIEIDSSGGELKSLHHFIARLRDWRRQGIRIETLALTQCCSAAAFMLSLGDIGCRMAMQRSVLLYHHTRVFGSAHPLTSDRLEMMKHELSLVDAELIVELLRHLYSQSLRKEHFAFLEELTCSLPYPMSPVNRESFEILSHQTKVKSMLSKIESAKGSEKRQLLKGDLHRHLYDCLKKSFEFHKGIERIDQLEKKLEGVPLANQDSLVVGWLLQRFEFYKHLFGRDVHISPSEAISAGLIDTIKE